MLRRLKDAAAKGTTKERDVADASRNTDASTEGFLCPICMHPLPTAEALQHHYEVLHMSSNGQNRADATMSADSPPASQPDLLAATGSDTPPPERKHSGSFVCPSCMKELSSADELQSHFHALHDLSENRDGDVLAMRHELNDLKASLKEEKWYSGELKKEMDKLQAQLLEKSQLAATSLPSGDELAYCMQQIQVLEAGKALVTTRMLEYEKEVSDLKRERESVRRENERILAKTAHMAKDYASMRAQFDEESSQKIALGEEVITLRDRLNSLRVTLDERPSEDDVSVLRKELVNAQTLMDTLTQDREAMLEQWQMRCGELESRCEMLGSKNADLERQLNSAPKADDIIQLRSALSDNASKLQADVEHKSQEASRLASEIDKARKEIEEKTAELVQKIEECDQLRAQSQSAESQCALLRSQVNKVEEDLITVKVANEKMTAGLAGLNDTVTALQKKLESQQAEHHETLRTRDEELAALRVEKLKAEQNERSSMSQVEDLQRQLQHLQVQFQDQQSNSDDVNSSMRDLQTELEEANRQNEKKQLRMQELDDSIVALKDAVEKMGKEKVELLAKIDQGEGANMAISQLTQEKTSLQEGMALLEQRLAAKSTEMDTAVDKFHKDLALVRSALEDEKVISSRAQKQTSDLTQELSSMREKYLTLDSEFAAKCQLLTTTEAARDSQKADLERRFASTQSTLDEKASQVTQLGKQLEEMVGKYDESKQLAARHQHTVKEQAEKLTGLQEKLAQTENALCAKNVDFETSTERVHALESEAKTAQSALRSAEDQLHKAEAAVEHEKATRLGLEAEMRRTCSELEKQVAQLQAEKQSSIVSAQEIQVTLDAKHSELQDLSKSLTQEREAHQSKLDAALSTSKAELAKLAEKLEHVQEALSSKKEALAAAEARERNLVDEVGKLREERQDLSERFDQLRSEHTRLEQLVENQRYDMEQASGRSAAAEKELAQLKESLMEHSERATQAEGDARHLKDVVENLTVNLRDKTDTADRLHGEFERQKAALDELREKADEVTKELSQKRMELEMHAKVDAELRSAKVRLEEDVAERNKRYEDLCATRLALEKQVTEMQERHKNEKAAAEQEIHDLEQSRNAFKSIKADLDIEIAQLQTQIGQAEQEHKKTKTLMEEAQKGLQADLDAAKNELVSAKQTHDADRHAANEREALLLKQADTLTDSLAQLRVEVQQAKNDTNALRKERDELKSLKEDLEAQVTAWQDEKRVLVERCLNVERDLDEERDRAEMVKRRYDDAIAAMHELGRENQSLQIDMSKHLTRKWADDTEAVNCTACGKQFSLTVRKHHCRNCGLIFCNECSMKLATVASSKKQVRVCDNCYTELASR